MKIRVLGAAGAEAIGSRSTSFLVDGTTLVDAGSVGATLSLAEQRAIRHVLLSHAHLDHTAGLSYLTETIVFGANPVPLEMAASEPILAAMRSSFFNGVVWPDFSLIPTPEKAVLRYRPLAERSEVAVGALRVTPVAVDHTVPAVGYLVRNGTTGFAFSGDTGPTEALWQRARETGGITAVLIECSYPSRMADLARMAKHLTPALIEREIDRLPPDAKLFAYHVKPEFREEIRDELSRVASGRIRVVEEGETIEV